MSLQGWREQLTAAAMADDPAGAVLELLRHAQEGGQTLPRRLARLEVEISALSAPSADGWLGGHNLSAADRAHMTRRLIDDALRDLPHGAPGSAAEILAILEDVRPELAARFGLKVIGLVGSRASGQDDAASDIDLLVEPPPAWTFAAYCAAEDLLAARLGAKVDLISTRAAPPHILEQLYRDLQPVHG